MNHYDRPIKCNRFLLSHPLGVHCVMCKLRFIICKGYTSSKVLCTSHVQAIHPLPLVGPLLIFTKSANYFPILHDHKKIEEKLRL